MKRHEQLLQEACVAWLRGRGLLFVANPHANVKLTMQQAVRMKRGGYTAGTPDLIILEPRGLFHGLAVELKIYDNVCTVEQMQFLYELGKRCYKVMVVPKGSDYAEALSWFRDAVEQYLAETPC